MFDYWSSSDSAVFWVLLSDILKLEMKIMERISKNSICSSVKIKYKNVRLYNLIMTFSEIFN